MQLQSLLNLKQNQSVRVVNGVNRHNLTVVSLNVLIIHLSISSLPGAKFFTMFILLLFFFF